MKKYLIQLRELVEEGKKLVKTRPTTTVGLSSMEMLELINENNQKTEADCYSWFIRASQVIENIFGNQSKQYKLFISLYNKYVWEKLITSIEISFIKPDMLKQIAHLEAIIRLIENGVLEDLKTLTHVELFDDVIKEARELLKKGYLNVSAVYGRIILENTIKDLCKIHKVELSGKEKFSSMIDKLKSNDKISKSFWRELQAKYDLGNDAAHENFGEFREHHSENEITDMLSFIDNVLLPLTKESAQF
jgi:plasmid maintenance system antidote protein VapI